MKTNDLIVVIFMILATVIVWSSLKGAVDTDIVDVRSLPEGVIAAVAMMTTVFFFLFVHWLTVGLSRWKP